ncbi:MAG: hypothetical protein JWO58_126 [Chitinophagaceae bacterium]|nr:hypothetical protein [Chitinophagaceae bacterium]
MKIHFLTFVFTLLLLDSPSLLAQSNTSFIGISAGISAPTGSFSKTDLGEYGNWNNTAGFAKTGFNLGVEGAYYVLPKIGIGGAVNFSDHGKLSYADARQLGDSYTDAFAVDYTTVKTSKRYQTLNLLVGPYFSFPYHKLTLDIRLLGGWTKSISTPEISVQLEDDESNVFTQKSSGSSAFGWQGGVGLRYALTEKISLSIRGDYFYSSGIKIDNENRNNNAGRLVTNQTLSWINGSAGLAYVFGK